MIAQQGEALQDDMQLQLSSTKNQRAYTSYPSAIMKAMNTHEAKHGEHEENVKERGLPPTGTTPLLLMKTVQYRRSFIKRRIASSRATPVNMMTTPPEESPELPPTENKTIMENSTHLLPWTIAVKAPHLECDLHWPRVTWILSFTSPWWTYRRQKVRSNPVDYLSWSVTILSLPSRLYIWSLKMTRS